MSEAAVLWPGEEALPGQSANRCPGEEQKRTQEQIS